MRHHGALVPGLDEEVRDGLIVVARLGQLRHVGRVAGPIIQLAGALSTAQPVAQLAADGAACAGLKPVNPVLAEPLASAGVFGVRPFPDPLDPPCGRTHEGLGRPSGSPSRCQALAPAL